MDIKAEVYRFIKNVALSDPITRGLKVSSIDASQRTSFSVALSDPITRGLKAGI